MRFYCGPSLADKISDYFSRRYLRKFIWHPKFALFPTRVADEDGNEVCVWLEDYETKLEERGYGLDIYFERFRRVINKNKKET